MAQSIPIHECTCAAAVFDQLRNRPSPWWSNEKGPKQPGWIFRGHRTRDWKLIASLHREFTKPTDPEIELDHARLQLESSRMDRHPLDSFEIAPRLRMDLEHAIYKRFSHIVRDFASLAGRIGLINGVAAVDAAAVLSDDSPMYGACYWSKYPSLVGLAQHHGIFTPLLDWTWNPFVALWFAVVGIHDEQQRRNKLRHCQDGLSDNEESPVGEVWAIPTSMLPRHVRLRVVLDQAFAKAQDGVFTYYTEAESEFANRAEISSLDELILRDDRFIASAADSGERSHLPFRIQFPHSIKDELIQMLGTMGVSTPHLRPSLSAVADFAKNPLTP